MMLPPLNLNSEPSLPGWARLPINHANLPAVILGSLMFHDHPTELMLDSVRELHPRLYLGLDSLTEHAERAEFFRDYVTTHFMLHKPDCVGLTDSTSVRRQRLDYLRVLRGWMFDSDSVEAAVLKGWVESRFGLLPRYHQGPLQDFSGDTYQRYLADRSRGLYNTNSLEGQLDLLYSYCQYEWQRQQRPAKLELFRGVNEICHHDVLERPNPSSYIMLLNNINSFTSNAETADAFGDYLLQTQMPAAKLLYFPGLLPGTLKGEQEYLAIGGVYRLQLYRL